MFKTVIIGKNINYCKNLMNFLSTKNENLRIIGIFNNVDEFIEYVQKNPIDIILINAEYLEYTKILNNPNTKHYLKSIILISIKKLENLSVYGYIENSKQLNEIKNIVNNLIYSKIIENYCNTNSINNKELLQKIENELKALGVKSSYIGVKYIIESTYLLYNLDNYYKCNLGKDIYPLLAEKHHKTVSSIKSNITYATNMLYVECEEKVLLDYMKEYSLYKPSPKKLILSIVEKLKKENIGIA